MKVGFVTQLLWPRYGAFWTRLVASAGLEPVTAPDDRMRGLLDDPRLERVSGAAFKLAAAQALALEADVIVAPDLNPGESATRGGGQDPFIADFPGALAATLPGLPPVVAVPASLAVEGLESLVVRTLLPLTHDPAGVRRAWERHRSAARPPRLPEPKWRVRPSEGGTAGVVGQPWLLSGALVERAAGGYAVGQQQLDPEALRAEGRRAVPGLVGTDSEVLGAARYLGRKGGVERLMMIVDESAPTDAFLLGQVRKLVYKPLTVLTLAQLGEPQPTGRR